MLGRIGHSSLAREQTLAARLGPREEEEGKAWCARPDDELEREPWGRA